MGLNFSHLCDTLRRIESKNSRRTHKVDLNKVFLSGVVESEPVMTTLPKSGTPLCYFTLRVDERFISGKNKEVIRPNYFRIESIGKQAQTSFEKVKFGGKYFVDGYLRQENSLSNKIDIVKVRSYGVISDPSKDSHHYNLGLKKALSILSSAKTIEIAEELISKALEASEDT